MKNMYNDNVHWNYILQRNKQILKETCTFTHASYLQQMHIVAVVHVFHAIARLMPVHFLWRVKSLGHVCHVQNRNTSVRPSRNRSSQIRRNQTDIKRNMHIYPCFLFATDAYCGMHRTKLVTFVAWRRAIFKVTISVGKGRNSGYDHNTPNSCCILYFTITIVIIYYVERTLVNCYNLCLIQLL
jgi:hypothetical protein